MIRWRYSLVSLFVFVMLAPAAKAGDKKKAAPALSPVPQESVKNPKVQLEKREKLRKALSLPCISAQIGYGVNSRRGFVDLADLSPDPDKIAAIEKELKGDATDAERYYRLATLCNLRAYQSAKAKEARLKAAALFRKQLEQYPDDIVIRLRLADVLDLNDKTEEAEALVRRVVKNHPNHWSAWLLLGKILDGKCWVAILGRKPFHFSGPETLVQGVRAAQPTPERIAASQRYRREADACFDRAVHLATEEAEVYLRRGASHYGYEMLEWALRSYKGEKTDFFDCFLGREVGQEILPDLRRAVDLDRQEYKGIGVVDFLEMMRVVRDRQLREPSAKLPEKLVNIVSPTTRKQICQDIARLEKGVQNSDKYKAAEAAEVLGYLQLFLFADYSAAEKRARRSIELNPKREAAWDILSGCLMEAKDLRKFADACRERLEHKDSAHNRVMLAKAHEYLEQLDKAEEVVRAGLQREPDDFMLRLTLADLLLMRGDHQSLHEAGGLLGKLSRERLSDGGSENRWANYAFACGVYGGLIGKPEQARQWLTGLQKRHPKFSGLEDALKALQE